jgi:hypothetical protein
MKNSIKLTLVFLLINFFNTDLHAQQNEIVTFYNNYGWRVGDFSKYFYLHEGVIQVNIEVKSSTLTGKHYYIVNMENLSDRKITFGARLTATYPSETHFSVTLEPGQIRKWGEHLTAGVNEIYFLASPPREIK